MAQNENIPVREEVTEGNGMITRAWHQFLYKLFGDFEKRIAALETTSADHESRIEALEP